MRFTIFSLVLPIFGSITAFSQTNDSSCISLVFREQNVTVGTVCKTKRGSFKRVRDADGLMGWVDRSSRLVWYDDHRSRIDYYQATAFCNKYLKGKRLPTISDLELAIDHDISEIYFDQKQKSVFLSDIAPAHGPNDSPDVWTGGYFGKSRGSSSLDYASDSHQARCVGTYVGRDLDQPEESVEPVAEAPATEEKPDDSRFD